MIACLLLPYFAAALTQRGQTGQPSSPLILSSGPKVAATCERAATQGVSFGMSLRQATWLCPEAQVIPLNLQALRRSTEEVVQVLSQFTHLIETERITAQTRTRTPLFADARQSAVFYVDLERLASPGTLELAQHMVRTLPETTGWAASCGIATTKFAAYAAACETPAGQVHVVPGGAEAPFLDPLPITLLPMKAETRRRLLLLGIQTLGAFAALPVSAAAAQCGKDGVLLHQLAHGIDPRRVVPVVLQVVEQITRLFELPLTDSQPVEANLRVMAAELSARLQQSGCVGKTLHLQLALEGDNTLQVKRTLRQAVSSTRYLSEALLRLLARLQVDSGVCAITVTLADLVPFSGQQLELFPDQPKPRERLHQRLSGLLSRPDAPACFWITSQDPAALRIEHRYSVEQVAPV